MKMRAVGNILVAALLCGLAGISMAQTAGETIVKERQHAMKAMAEAAKTVSGMFEGRRPYSGEALKAAAEAIRARAGASLTSLFPAETLGSPSAATDAVATDRSEFNRIADRLEDLAVALALAGERAPDRITDDMRMSSTQMMGGSLLGARRQRADEDVSKLPAEHVFHLMLEPVPAVMPNSGPDSGRTSDRPRRLCHPDSNASCPAGSALTEWIADRSIDAI